MSFKVIKIGYIFLGIILLVFSYGFVDRNLKLSSIPLYHSLQAPLQHFVYESRTYASALYLLIIAGLFILYFQILSLVKNNKISSSKIKEIFVISSTIFLLSYPAFSYDLFNYMATARVTFTWRENPWVIMPIDIKNEPALAYTRAANKVALYGPTWVFLTSIPHYLGVNQVWFTIITFKALVFIFYLFVIWLIFRVTNNLWNVVFFGLNPLVLLEVVLGGHNDIVMMGLALASILLIRHKVIKNRFLGFVLWALSIMVKGATIVLFPLQIFRKVPLEVVWNRGFWLMFGVFLLTPFREELYPWYFVWCLIFAALMPSKLKKNIHVFSILITIGLLLRHTPYIYSREYGGVYQLARSIFTITPLALYGIYLVFIKYIRPTIKKV